MFYFQVAKHSGQGKQLPKKHDTKAADSTPDSLRASGDGESGAGLEGHIGTRNSNQRVGNRVESALSDTQTRTSFTFTSIGTYKHRPQPHETTAALPTASVPSSSRRWWSAAEVYLGTSERKVVPKLFKSTRSGVIFKSTRSVTIYLNQPGPRQYI